MARPAAEPELCLRLFAAALFMGGMLPSPMGARTVRLRGLEGKVQCVVPGEGMNSTSFGPWKSFGPAMAGNTNQSYVH